MFTDCVIVIKVIPLFWGLAKGCLYSIFVWRMEIAFGKSIYAYSRNTIHILFCIVFINTVALIISTFIFSTGLLVCLFGNF